MQADDTTPKRSRSAFPVPFMYSFVHPFALNLTLAITLTLSIHRSTGGFDPGANRLCARLAGFHIRSDIIFTEDTWGSDEGKPPTEDACHHVGKRTSRFASGSYRYANDRGPPCDLTPTHTMYVTSTHSDHPQFVFIRLGLG